MGSQRDTETSWLSIDWVTSFSFFSSGKRKLTEWIWISGGMNLTPDRTTNFISYLRCELLIGKWLSCVKYMILFFVELFWLELFYVINDNINVCMGAKLCLTLCNPVDYSQPGFSVLGILQARILEWVAVPSSRGSSPPWNQTRISASPALAGGFFTTSSTWKAPINNNN